MKPFSRTLALFAGLVVFAVAARAVGITDMYWRFGTAGGSGLPFHSSDNVTGGVMAANQFDVLYAPAFDSVNPSAGYSGLNGISRNHNASVEVKNFAGPITSFADTFNPTATYFEFTLTPASGMKLQATAFELGSRSETGVGPTTLTLVASSDGFATAFNLTILGTTTLTANSNWALYNVPMSPTTWGFDTPVTFRIYGTDGTGGLLTPNWRIDDVTLSLVAVPEPSTYATLLGGLLLLGARALRRRKPAVA
ncbi:MAG: PEP-CTERM sorting domain-containing protein [Opitutaceae bacterium]